MNKKLGGALVVIGAIVAAYLLFFRHHEAKPVAKVPTSGKTQFAASKREAATPAIELDLDREGPLRMEGQVIDADGAGVGGAEVWLNTVPPRTVKTEGDGSFSFDKLVGRAYRLTARHANELAGPIVYKLTDKSDPAILQLVAGAKLIVSVTDDQRKPIKDAEVAIDEEHVTAKTGDDGLATLTPVTPGWVGAHAKAEGFAPNAGFTSVGSANSTGRIEIVLHAGVSVTGHVYDEKGAPIASAQISTQGIWNLGSSVEPVTSDDKGAYTLVLAAGTHTLVAVDKEHAPTKSTPFVVGTKPVTGIDITMKSGGRIAGRVVDAKHLPVPFATIRTTGKGTDMWSVPKRQTTSNQDGSFELRGLSRTKLGIRAESDVAGSRLATIDLTTDGEKKDLELMLDVTGTISGVVVDDKGTALAEVTVGSSADIWGGADEDESLAGVSTATTDGDGKFTLHGLADGTYKLHATRHELRQQFQKNDGVSAKTGETNARIVLATPGSIKGAVATVDGPAPKFASVRVGFRPGTPMNADGKFLVDELEPGEYDVVIHGPEFADITKHGVKVETGKVADLGTITVPKGRSVTGRVVDSASNPVAGAKIKAGRMMMAFQGAEDQAAAFEDAYGMRSAYSDQEGNFTLVGVAPGETNVMADHPDKGRSNAVEVAAGDSDPPPVTLQLRGYGTIVGKATIKGQPATGMAITDTPKSGGAQLQIIQADDSGAFTITKVAEGVHVVSAMQQGMGSFKTSSTTVTVVSGQTVNVALDIQIGAVTLDVDIKPLNGAALNAAQIFLFHGTMSMTNAKDLQNAFLGGQAAGMKFWMGTTPAEFTELVPGDYSACSVPITGNMGDATFLQRLQEHMDLLKVYCRTVAVTASPAKQLLTQSPSMIDLPPPKS